MSNRTTILILSHNRSWSLMQTVASIREWTLSPYRIVIQDHKSDQRHWPLVKRLAGPDCTVVRADAILSCNEGRRIGLDHVTGRYCVFLDDDIKVERGWLGRMLAPMLKYRDVGAVCGQLVQNFGNPRMSWARMMAGGRAERMDYGFTGWCDFCGGGATLYDIEALRKTEFRSEFNGTAEDWDQVLQMNKMGYRTYCTDVEFFHFHQKDYDEYGTMRWRYTEILDSAIGLFNRWGIKSVATEIVSEMVRRGIPLQHHQREQVKEIIGL